MVARASSCTSSVAPPSPKKTSNPGWAEKQLPPDHSDAHRAAEVDLDRRPFGLGLDENQTIVQVLADSRPLGVGCRPLLRAGSCQFEAS